MIEVTYTITLEPEGLVISVKADKDAGNLVLPNPFKLYFGFGNFGWFIDNMKKHDNFINSDFHQWSKKKVGAI